MNILLLSDSHGHPDRIREAAERTRPDCILFAGDGLRDLAGAHTAPDVRCTPSGETAMRGGIR